MTIKRFANTLIKLSALGALLVLALTPVRAADLDQAKNQGMVCELPTGYLQSTGSATPEVREMVNNINAKRKVEYTRIANENNVKPEEVGILTGKKLQPRCQ